MWAGLRPLSLGRRVFVGERRYCESSVLWLLVGEFVPNSPSQLVPPPFQRSSPGLSQRVLDGSNMRRWAYHTVAVIPGGVTTFSLCKAVQAAMWHTSRGQVPQHAFLVFCYSRSGGASLALQLGNPESGLIDAVVSVCAGCHLRQVGYNGRLRLFCGQ